MIKNQFNNNLERDGYWEEYDSDGKLRFKGNYKDGKRYGFWEEYLTNGNLSNIFIILLEGWYKHNYKDGKRHGYCEHYHLQWK